MTKQYIIRVGAYGTREYRELEYAYAKSALKMVQHLSGKKVEDLNKVNTLGLHTTDGKQIRIFQY